MKISEELCNDTSNNWLNVWCDLDHHADSPNRKSRQYLGNELPWQRSALSEWPLCPTTKAQGHLKEEKKTLHKKPLLFCNSMLTFISWGYLHVNRCVIYHTRPQHKCSVLGERVEYNLVTVCLVNNCSFPETQQVHYDSHHCRQAEYIMFDLQQQQHLSAAAGWWHPLHFTTTTLMAQTLGGSQT